jgi:hypothetical protein
VYSPQLIFIGRYEFEKMSQQANGAACVACTGGLGGGQSASNLGNITTYTIGFRYNPFMTSRAGLSLAQRIQLAAPGWHGPGDSACPTANINTGEVLMGLDFDF